MEKRNENTVAESVTDKRVKPLIQYRTLQSLVINLKEMKQLSEVEYDKNSAFLARQFGYYIDSIFR